MFSTGENNVLDVVNVSVVPFAILCAAERVNALPSMLATVVLIPVAVTTSPTFIFVVEAVHVTLTLLLTAPFT